jgi:protein-S-isoprenylcysteine O-methyltransferase Ste14
VHDPGRAATTTARLFAWMGAGLFVLSLSYFLYAYWTVFGSRSDGPLRAVFVVWNVVLFSVFALHHTVFARERVRLMVTRVFGRLERSFYVWVASVLLIAVCKLWQPLPGMAWETSGALSVVLLCLQIAGIALSVYSAAAIDIWELAGVRQLNSRLPTTPPSRPESRARFGETSPELVTRAPQAAVGNSQTPFDFKTSGPYGLVRHPIYLGWFLIVFAVGTMTMTRFVFAVVSCAYVLLAIPFEERSLRRSSNGAYDRYMKQVRRKLVPGLY